MRSFVLGHPLAVTLFLVAVAAAFRLLDIFVLRLDERWGEILLSKLVAIGLVTALVVITGSGWAAIGLRAQGAALSVLLGTVLTCAALAAGYAAEFAASAMRGGTPRFVVAAVDPTSGLSGTVVFAGFLVVGNIVNAFAEEGLFRGLLVPVLLRTEPVIPTLLLSAALFGVWHIPWALKALPGAAGEPNAIVGLFAANFVPQFALGLVWAYLYLCTGNLWGAVVSHFITNSAVNFLHVRVGDELDSGMAIRIGVFSLAMLLGMVVMRWATQSLGVPALKPW